VEAFMSKFGDRLPARMNAQLRKMKERLA